MVKPSKMKAKRKMTPSKYHGDKNQCFSQQTKLQKETCHKLSMHQKGETVEQPSSKIHLMPLNQLLFTPALLPRPQFQYPKLRAEVHHSKTRSWNNKPYQIVHKHESAPVPFAPNSTKHSTAPRQRVLQVPILCQDRKNPTSDPASTDNIFQLTCLSKNSLVSFSICPS